MNSIAFDVENEKRFSRKLQLFLKKLLEGFVAQNKELCGLTMEFFASLPNDVKQLLDFSGTEGTFAPKTGCEV